MKRLSCFMLLGAAVGLLALSCEEAPNPVESSAPEKNGVSSLAKARVFHSNLHAPIDELRYDFCRDEYIHLIGAYHFEVHTVFDGNGGVHFQFTANSYNVSGVGLVSGIKYRQVGSTVGRYNASGSLPYNETWTNTFNFIGQGPEDNIIIKDVLHFTVNANGVTTVERSKSTMECR